MNSETNKKRIKNYIVDYVLDEKLFDVTILQKRPYTCAVAKIYFQDKEYEEIGFSKVMWTDKWNEEKGKEMAVKRAIRQFACDFVEGNYTKTIAQKKRLNTYLRDIESKLEML